MNTSSLILHPDDALTRACVDRGCRTFADAASLIAALPYRRNTDRQSILAPLTESCGTCSTKHMFLYALATANGFNEHMQLCIGVYRMHAGNTPGVGDVLRSFGLQEIPEAHCYLRIGDQIADHTSARFSLPFVPDLMEEHVLRDTHDLLRRKEQLHKNAIARWAEEVQLDHTPEQLWTIREACIAALS